MSEMREDMHPATRAVAEQFRWNVNAFAEQTDIQCQDVSDAFEALAVDLANWIEGPDTTALLRDLLSVRNDVIMRLVQDL